MKINSLTFSPEAEAPLCCGDLPILVAVAGVEEGSDADLVLVQVNSSQLSVVKIQVAVGVQLREHPADGVLAAGYQALVQCCWLSQHLTLISFLLYNWVVRLEEAENKACLRVSNLKPCLRQACQSCSASRFHEGVGTSLSGGHPGLPGPGRCSSLKEKKGNSSIQNPGRRLTAKPDSLSLKASTDSMLLYNALTDTQWTEWRAQISLTVKWLLSCTAGFSHCDLFKCMMC